MQPNTTSIPTSPLMIASPVQPLLLAAYSVTSPQSAEQPKKTWLERIQERDAAVGGKGWGKGNHTRVVKRKKGAA